MSNSKLFGATRIERKEEKCAYTWTVSNLNLLSEENIVEITSPQFSIKDKKWSIVLSMP